HALDREGGHGPAHVAAHVAVLEPPDQQGIHCRGGNHAQMARQGHGAGQLPVGDTNTHPSLDYRGSGGGALAGDDWGTRCSGRVDIPNSNRVDPLPGQKGVPDPGPAPGPDDPGSGVVVLIVEREAVVFFLVLVVILVVLVVILVLRLLVIFLVVVDVVVLLAVLVESPPESDLGELLQLRHRVDGRLPRRHTDLHWVPGNDHDASATRLAAR